ncbi:NUC169 domain-domain-containing protein [Protomyces lactucae-debilis]|uniref:Ribosome biogenesis protein ERB1 n=1 Tax=Protomyces lactucae-debilis TaxID=2754530 RepID=A0A1Y2F515_PROLT|nr:NUC169 domain-containing protein [Protomyces lactucae-debilis]ORY78574.1 NUC169 domain-domain-containing protein [Protomyces lactucae-debilis]
MLKRTRTQAKAAAKTASVAEAQDDLLSDDFEINDESADEGSEHGSDIPEEDIKRAIEAAMRGEILEDEELDSDELVPLSDEEDVGSEQEAKEEDDASKAGSEDPSEEDPDVDELVFTDSDDSEDGDSLFTVTGADGEPRKMRPEIQAGYESDSSTEEAGNTVGNIDLALYDALPHLGYDINGKRIMRPAVGKALDALLETMEGSEGYTGITDRNTGLDVKLSESELDIIKRIKRAEMPDADYNAYEDYVDYFSGVVEQSALSGATEPKSRFVPSKHEQKRVIRIVRAIREGRIVPNKPVSTQSDNKRLQHYDVWENEVAVPDHIMNIPAPKMSLPGHAESYNPPAEYLPSKEEEEAWLAADPEDRDRDFMPKKFASLRVVPGYSDLLKERFERCLDLYLAPRVRRNKLNIDPESLVPKLPSPQDLRPFPTKCSHIMRGHTGRVRCLHASPDGNFLATGSDDGTVKFWEVLTGRCLSSVPMPEKEPVLAVRWSPNAKVGLLLVSAGEYVYLMTPPLLFSDEIEMETKQAIQTGYAYQAQQTQTAAKKEPPCKWLKPTDSQQDQGFLLVLAVRKQIKQVDWHRRGDYFSTVCPDGSASGILIHQMSKHASQAPFAKTKGAIQSVLFHPTKPVLFVASQRYIRVYDLQKQALQRTLQSGVRWISCMSIHPGGDNLIIGSYDKKLAWFDLDLSPRPYKTLKYHTKAVRAVQYHDRYPLFASSADDGTIQCFHGQVHSDLSKNALIVPLKILKGHAVEQSLGVLEICWHTKQPWLFSAGADGTVRMWT